MSEDAELQAKIAELSGRIHRQKQHGAPQAHQVTYKPPPRWSPYNQAFSQYPNRHFARGGYKAPTFRNRSLVNNSSAVVKDAGQGQLPAETSSVLESGVTTRDRGRMQWTNASVYEKKAQEKIQAIAETAHGKRQARNESQKNKVIEHVYGQQSGTSTPSQVATPREIVINDLRFRVATDGSKLFRVFDESNKDPQSTPRETKVAGVTFVRTKHGNMIRQGLLNNRTPVVAGTRPLCADFTSTGTCNRGNRCKFQHDVEKLAICKEFLRRGECAAGEDCNLSHDPNPHRVPTCLHFLRNACTKADCRFAHVQVDPSAPVCKDFARLGFCEKGASCADRHVSECPDYTNTGVCRNSKCRLPHIDRAGTLRKAVVQKSAKNSDDDLSFEVSSDEEEVDKIDSDDADSDDIDEDVLMAGSSDAGHELSQQQDFISFS